MDNKLGIGDLVALITVAGAVIYVLGLVGLAVSIRYKLTGNFSTAWYVVSLLPRTVVVGQGVRLWLTWPIIATAVFLLTAILQKPILALVFAILGDFLGGIVVDYLFIIILLVLASTSYFRLLPGNGSTKVGCGATGAGGVGLGLIAAGASMIAGVEKIAKDVERGEIIPPAVLVPTVDSLPVGIMLIFFGSFVVGVPKAMALDPPLPPREYNRAV